MDPKDVPGYGNGGPAFPNDIAMNTLDRGGMTLRDYFAAKAMQMHGQMLSDMECNGPEAWDEAIAQRAYMTADAMIAKRAKEQQ